VRASYLLLVDESGSMRPFWGSVRQALVNFSAAIPEGDQLDVRLFANTVRTLLPPVASTAETRPSWVRTLGTLAEPAGAKTDLGRAAASVAASIRALPPERLAFVFVLTDGRQDPEPGSPFSASGGGEWTSLANELRTLASARPVHFVVLRLTADADAQTLLRRTLPRSLDVDVTAPGALSAWFATATREVAVEKLRLVIRDELRHPAARLTADEPLASGRLGASDGTVRLERTRRVVEARFTGDLATDGRNVRIGLSAPGLVPAERAWQLSITDTRPWYRPPERSGSQESVTLVGPATLEPAAELSRIGIDPAARPDSIRVDVPVRQPAVAYWAVVALLATGATVLAAWLAHRAYVPSANGTVVVTTGDAERTERLALVGVASRQLLDATGRHVATIRTERRWFRRTRTTVTAGPTVLRMGGKPLRGPTKLARSTRLDGDGCFLKILLD